MGKKAKVGKRRKDKFYHLAKETGYRARSAFKLIQLNRKFGFLQKSRCLIDLCAAPGGWLQVATKFMPISSLIVGVDLVPIKPIRNVITFAEDITTDKCKQLLKKELKTWKADCVLNDGAPNVGTAWVQDAFSQAELTLSAFKLACENLREGGWFVTKVFRSKDYQPLLWVFQQLFKQVHSTKPQASRNESAEIFVVCQGFIAPSKIDPKMLDPKYVFQEVQADNLKKPTLLNEKAKKRAEGYGEGDYTLHKITKVSDFIKSETPLEFLTECNQIGFDDDTITNHKLTTEEIIDCCKDIKVLGKPDVRSLLAWQKILRKEMHPKVKEPKSGEDKEVDEEEAIENTIQTLRNEEDAEVKRQKRKVQLQRQKLRDKMQLKMVLPEDTKDIQDDAEMFSLANIRTKKHLDAIDDMGANLMDDGAARAEDDEEEVELEEGSEVGSDDDDEKDEEESDEEEDEEEDEDADNDDEEDDKQPSPQENVHNPLLVKLQEDETTKMKTDQWFEKDMFQGVIGEEDEDLEISLMLEQYKKKGGKIIGEKEEIQEKDEEETGVQEKRAKLDISEKEPAKKKGNKKDNKKDSKDDDSDDDDSDSDDSSDSDSDSDYDMEAEEVVVEKKQTKTKSDGDFEVVPQETSKSFSKKLTPEGLALGAQMAFSRKRKRDIVDDAFHRWSFNDQGLPSWFVEDEARCTKRVLPITKAEVDEYKARLKEINARPIKKVAEAKGRKKRKEMKREEKARKKAEAVCDAPDVTPQEKMKQINNLYKKAAGTKKKEIKYVVTKKHQAAKRMKRPAGVTGPFKVVDGRLKKDLRARKSKEKTKGRRKR